MLNIWLLYTGFVHLCCEPGRVLKGTAIVGLSEPVGTIREKQLYMDRI